MRCLRATPSSLTPGAHPLNESTYNSNAVWRTLTCDVANAIAYDSANAILYGILY